ncbi:MAG: cytochrome P450 [Aeromonadales bacterium]|nr:cytochrome P450 [Aeromonadales bacterium]
MTAYSPDNDASSEEDLRSLTDRLRPKQAIIQNDDGEWELLRYRDVSAVALDDKRFSSQVSRFLQIPNGLDGEQHHQFRTLIDRHLSESALTPFLPLFKQVAAELIATLPKHTPIDAVSDIGAVFAVRAQCAWLGWPATLEPQLLQWMRNNHAAARSKDDKQLAQVAQNFDDIIRSVVQPRRSSPHSLADDVTSRLCREHINGRLLTEAELVSILRNWTGGDLSSIALCVGVIVAHLLHHPEQIADLKNANDSELEAVIDEVLRLDNPFSANRRITTCPVTIAGQALPEGARVRLNWISANRDEQVFNNNEFAPHEHRPDNVVYGLGKHVCPGRLLATWQLRIAIKALLQSVNTITLAPQQMLERERPPLGGYHKVPIVLT